MYYRNSFPCNNMDFHRYACNVFLAYLSSIQNYVLDPELKNAYATWNGLPSFNINTFKKAYTVNHSIEMNINVGMGEIERLDVFRSLYYNIPEHRFFITYR